MEIVVFHLFSRYSVLAVHGAQEQKSIINDCKFNYRCFFMSFLISSSEFPIMPLVKQFMTSINEQIVCFIRSDNNRLHFILFTTRQKHIHILNVNNIHTFIVGCHLLNKHQQHAF